MRPLRWLTMAPRWVLVAPVLLYRATLSKIMPPVCRFTPSCSQYGRDAILRHGALKGGWLTVYRLFRCQPFARGGYDPVPPAGAPFFPPPPSSSPEPEPEAVPPSGEEKP